MLGLFVALMLVAPPAGFVAGFLTGKIRRTGLRAIAAFSIISSPLLIFLVPLLDPSTSADERYGAAFGLTIFGFHIGLWILFTTLGIFVGAASRSGPH